MSAVFLDRDGVINQKAPAGSYITSWGQFKFLPGALNGLALLARCGLPIIVVTNQRGIAKGKMTSADLEEIHRCMNESIVAVAGRLDAIYICPHDTGCGCRKPEIGMFEAAAADFGLRLADTVMLGDQPSDMLAARRIGALRVLLRGGVDQVADQLPRTSMHGNGDADYLASDLADAAKWLVDHGHLCLQPTTRHRA